MQDYIEGSEINETYDCGVKNSIRSLTSKSILVLTMKTKLQVLVLQEEFTALETEFSFGKEKHKPRIIFNIYTRKEGHIEEEVDPGRGREPVSKSHAKVSKMEFNRI